jgi:hypothetical protein
MQTVRYLEPRTAFAAVGLTWHPNGQCSLEGPLLALYERLDATFVGRIAAPWDATEERHPPFIAAAELDKLDFFRSFPHLATFPVWLKPGVLETFGGDEISDGQGNLRLRATGPVRDALTPAACYHLYIRHQNTTLDGPRHLTTCNTCFRHEAYFRPLERHWSFTMREVVCLGSRDEVEFFLEHTRAQVDALLGELDLPVAWCAATDPFYRPRRSASYATQKRNPVKYEAVLDGRLPIASANLRQDHFGSAFHIRRGADDAYTGCIAFGVERWLLAILTRWGAEPSRWPTLDTSQTVRCHG